MKNLVKALGLAFFICGVQAAQADMVFNVGGAAPGGHDLIAQTDEELEAGAGIYANFGLAHRRNDSPWQCQATIGIKLNAADFTGGDATLRAYPLHLMGFYKKENFRYGAGLVYDFAIELDVTGDNPYTTDYKNAPGLVLEIDHLIGEKYYWGVRYIQMDYKEKNGSDKFNANNLGAHFGMFF